MLTNVNIASSIPHLMSFLLNYSLSRHSHLKAQSILDPSLVQDLTQHGDQMVQDTISILKFQEHFYHSIFLQPRANDSLLVQDQHVIPKLFGFFAILVALMLDTVPGDLHSQMFPAGFDWRHLIGENPSTIEHLAFLILSLYNLDVQDLNFDFITISDDLESKLSLGLEMARYRRAPEASAILGLCIIEMETIGCISSRECCIVTTELVKCYNMMNEEAKAEKLALRVLGSQRDPHLKFHQDLCHLNVALADTLMGQGEYQSAEFLMLDVLTVDSLPRPTETMIRLRLNKARRRLGRGEFIASVKNDFMQPILETVADLNRDLKVEVLAELSATISLAPKQKDSVFEELTFLCHETVAALSSDHDIMGDWRFLALKQELVRLNNYTSRNKGFEDAGLRNASLGDAHQPGLEVWDASEKELDPDLMNNHDTLEAVHLALEAVHLGRPSGRSYTGMLGRLFSRRAHTPDSDTWFERIRSSLNQTSSAEKPKRKTFRSYLNLLGRLLPQNRSSFEDMEMPVKPPRALEMLHELGAQDSTSSELNVFGRLLPQNRNLVGEYIEPFELEARVPTTSPNPINDMLPFAWWINANGPDSQALDQIESFKLEAPVPTTPPTPIHNMIPFSWWTNEYGTDSQAFDLSDAFQPMEMLPWREQEGRDEVDTSEYVSTLEVVPQQDRDSPVAMEVPQDQPIQVTIDTLGVLKTDSR